MAVAAGRAPRRHLALEDLFLDGDGPRPRFLVSGQRHRDVAVGVALEAFLLEDLRDLAVEDDLGGDWHVARRHRFRPERLVSTNRCAEGYRRQDGLPPLHL